MGNSRSSGAANGKIVKAGVPSATPVMATVVVDETDSFVDPEQFTIIKNLINADFNMFTRYLDKRRTVGDVNLHTRELKLLIDNGLFVAAYAYQNQHRDVKYNALLANRPASLQRYTANAENFKDIIVNWVAIIAIDTENPQLYLDFVSKYPSIRLNYRSTEDPSLTYAKVKAFLEVLLIRRHIGIDNTKTHDLPEAGIFRVARFVLERNKDYKTHTTHLQRMYAIEPFNVPSRIYDEFVCAKEYDGAFKFLAEANQELYDRQVEKIDWNTSDTLSSDRAVFLSDAAFERAMNMVWKRELVEKYREHRAKRGDKTV